MVRSIGGCTLAICSVACAAAEEEPLPAAELAAPCGAPEPVELFALEPDTIAKIPIAIGDRVLALVRDMDEGVELPLSGRIVSADACGGDARVVLDADAFVVPSTHATAPVLAWSYEDEALHRIDPLGLRDPQPLGRGSVVGEVDGVRYLIVLADDEESATLVRLVVHDDGLELQPVLEGLSPLSARASGQGRLPTAFVLTLEQELVAVDLATGATSVVAAPVKTFAVGGDARFLLYQVPRDYASDSLFEPWYVVDRDTGVHAFLSNVGTASFDQAAARTETFDAVVETRVLMLPGLQAHALDGWWASFRSTEDGRVVATRLLQVSGDLESEYWVFDTPEAEPRRLPFRGSAVQTRVDADGVFIITREGEHRLQRLPLDGSPAVTVAARIFTPHWLPDGRFVTVRNADDAGHGDLVVFSGGRPALVEDDVYGDVYILNLWTDPASLSFFYQVHADDRRGLWFAQLAP